MKLSRTASMLAALLLCACTRAEPAPLAREAGSAPSPSPALSPASVAVKGTFKHETTAFTQGLAFWKGRLFEGTGMYGESSLRELDPRTGKVLRQVPLDAKYFGEGITVLDGRIYELTWKEHTCLVYDVETLHEVAQIPFDAEGWGIATDGSSLITSDGSPVIRFREPRTLRPTRSITVVSPQGVPVSNINELELVNGVLWANVWMTDIILKIAPDTGRVIEMIDTAKLLPKRVRSEDPDDVLNGIAFDEASHRILITGKRWPEMIELSAK